MSLSLTIAAAYSCTVIMWWLQERVVKTRIRSYSQSPTNEVFLMSWPFLQNKLEISPWTGLPPLSLLKSGLLTYLGHWFVPMSVFPWVYFLLNILMNLIDGGFYVYMSYDCCPYIPCWISYWNRPDSLSFIFLPTLASPCLKPKYPLYFWTSKASGEKCL